MSQTLDSILIGQQAAIVSIDSKSKIKSRLEQLGMEQGTKVKCLQKSPLGDPLAYLVCGAVLCLRKSDAKMIVVR